MSEVSAMTYWGKGVRGHGDGLKPDPNLISFNQPNICQKNSVLKIAWVSINLRMRKIFKIPVTLTIVWLFLPIFGCFYTRIIRVCIE